MEKKGEGAGNPRLFVPSEVLDFFRVIYSISQYEVLKQSSFSTKLCSVGL